MEAENPSGRPRSRTGERSLVWGVYIGVCIDSQLTEICTASLPIHVENDGVTKTTKGEDWKYVWATPRKTHDGVQTKNLLLDVSGFGFPNGHITLKLCLEPRLLIGNGRHQTRMERGVIPFMERRIRATELVYGASLDSRNHHYRNMSLSEDEKHIRARRDTLPSLEPPLFSPRQQTKVHVLSLDEGRGRLMLEYDACQYFHPQDGGKLGQMLISRAWLELDDPRALSRAVRAADHRVVCRINMSLRSEESNKPGESSQKVISTVLGRPQRIETSGFGKGRVLQWTSYLNSEHPNFEARQKTYSKSPSFPGIRLNGEDDKEAVWGMAFVQDGMDPDAVSSKTKALVSARFLQNNSVYMPDNDSFSNPQIVLPTRIVQNSIVTFKFYNCRNDQERNHPMAFEFMLRWSELANIHKEYIEQKEKERRKSGSQRSPPVPVPIPSPHESPKIGRRGSRKVKSSSRKASNPTSLNGSMDNTGGGGGGGEDEYRETVMFAMSSFSRRSSVNGSFRLKHRKSVSIDGGSVWRRKRNTDSDATRARRNTFVDEPVTNSFQDKPVLRFVGDISEDIKLNLTFTASTKRTSPRKHVISFDIISTSLIINDYLNTLSRAPPIKVKSI